jgi:predicted ester cyclase
VCLEKNKTLARRFHDLILEDIDEVLAPNFIGHDIAGHTWNRDQHKKFLAEDLASFADLHDRIHDMVAEGDRVAVRFTRSGIFKAQYQDYEPTSKTVNFPVMELIHIANGKIVEIWDYNDNAQVIRTLKGEE